MSRDEERRRPLGKLIVLQRAREEAARQALARAAGEEARASAAERAAEARAAEAAATARRAGQAPVGELPPAEILQFQSRFVRSMRRLAVETEQRRAAARGVRLTAAEAFARIEREFERARRARERFEAKQTGWRREAQRAREAREEADQDDRPPPDGA